MLVRLQESHLMNLCADSERPRPTGGRLGRVSDLKLGALASPAQSNIDPDRLANPITCPRSRAHSLVHHAFARSSIVLLHKG
jgi:hypothetical protein